MKLFKKIMASIAAGIVVISSVVPVFSSAKYKKDYLNMGKDPNDDGDITVADSTFILQCIRGKFEVTNYDRLDMDDNGVVSEADSWIVLLCDAGVST
ncbi:MAG: hypothetical protein K2J37_06560 [Ruminococcus sp.]|nr:hypothetical protein [Ruminococcus sp.]MDE6784935.1 hypothetical protein [Ruminococcus sp.]